MTGAGAAARKPRLERHYGRLLRLYPTAYRREHGAEVIGTLMESAADGRRRPVRESLALILGALRVGARRERWLGVSESWLAAAHAAAAMLLIYGVISDVWRTSPPSPLAGAVGVIGLVAALRRWYGTAALAATVAFVLSAPAISTLHSRGFPIVVILLLVLRIRRPQPASGLLRWMPVVPVLTAASDSALETVFPGAVGVTNAAFLAYCGVALLWLAVDERVTMAFGLLLLSSLLFHVWAVAGSGADPVWAVTWFALVGLPPVVLLLASAGINRRRARI